MTRQIRSAAPMPPSRTVRRRAGLLAVAAVAALGLGACSTQSPAATQLHYQPGDGIAVASGPVEVRDFVLVGTGDGKWRLAGNAYNSSSEETTVSFSPTPNATAGADATSSGVEVKLSPGQQVNLADEVYVLTGYGKTIPGYVVGIDVKTPKGGTTSARVPLMPPLTYYSTVTIPPAQPTSAVVPTQTPTPATATETATGTEAPTGTATTTN